MKNRGPAAPWLRASPRGTGGSRKRPQVMRLAHLDFGKGEEEESRERDRERAGGRAKAWLFEEKKTKTKKIELDFFEPFKFFFFFFAFDDDQRSTLSALSLSSKVGELVSFLLSSTVR